MRTPHKAWQLAFEVILLCSYCRNSTTSESLSRSVTAQSCSLRQARLRDCDVLGHARTPFLPILNWESVMSTALLACPARIFRIRRILLSPEMSLCFGVFRLSLRATEPCEERIPEATVADGVGAVSSQRISAISCLSFLVSSSGSFDAPKELQHAEPSHFFVLARRVQQRSHCAGSPLLPTDRKRDSQSAPTQARCQGSRA